MAQCVMRNETLAQLRRLPALGTLHFQDVDSLRPGYPRFEEFVVVRDRLDPDRRFTNRYLHRVLGP